MSLMQLLAMLAKFGPKLSQVWPYLIHISEDVQNIISILTDGQLPKLNAPSKEAKAFVKSATDAGMSKEEAERIAAGFQQFEEVVEEEAP